MGERLWQEEASRPRFLRQAIQARRRICADAVLVRLYLDERLTADLERAIVLTGDLDDRRGSDYIECTVE
jgi:hypothetical protein